MRQFVVEASDLRDDRGDLLLQGKMFVLDEEASNSSEVYGGEEILEIEVENVAPALMQGRIGDD